MRKRELELKISFYNDIPSSVCKNIEIAKSRLSHYITATYEVLKLLEISKFENHPNTRTKKSSHKGSKLSVIRTTLLYPHSLVKKGRKIANEKYCKK